MTADPQPSRSTCCPRNSRPIRRPRSPSCASMPRAPHDEPAPHYTPSREADVAGGAARRRHVVVEVRPGPRLRRDRRRACSCRAIRRCTRPSGWRSRGCSGRRCIEAMATDIAALVERVIDGFADRGEGDLVDDLAMPVPLTVMCWMLGMPQEDISTVPVLGAADGRGRGVEGGRGPTRGRRGLPRLLRLLRAHISGAPRRIERRRGRARRPAHPAADRRARRREASPSSRSSASASSCSSPAPRRRRC